jgi:hypothetical protein
VGDFKTVCKDFKDKKGCGKEITMHQDPETSKWKPLNADGSEHKHAGTTGNAQKDLKDAVSGDKMIELWVRKIAREETGRVLAEYGIGLTPTS